MTRASSKQPAPQVDAAQQVTPDANPVRAYATPSVAVSPKDPDILAVSDGEGRSANCRVQVSTNAGLSWSQTADFTPPGYPVCVYGNRWKVNDVEPAAHWGCCTFEPRLSVAPNGRIDVAPLGVVSTDGAAFIAWDDTRNSVGDTQSQDIYLGRVRFPVGNTVFASGPTTHENKLLWSLLGAAVALAVAGAILLAAQRLRRDD